jgi:NADH-quinone oxidoreductase subunit J
MSIVFYIACGVAIIATILTIIQLNAIHALLYLIVSLFSVAVIFFTIGAPFVAALEVIIYAGAIMVLFVFIMMMLILGPESTERERKWLTPSVWIGPALLSGILLGELIAILAVWPHDFFRSSVIAPKLVGMALFGPYLLCVELAGMLLMAGIVGAFHLGKKKNRFNHRFLTGGSQ